MVLAIDDLVTLEGVPVSDPQWQLVLRFSGGSRGELTSPSNSPASCPRGFGSSVIEAFREYRRAARYEMALSGPLWS
jgi:hypothetical protein